MAPKNKAKAKGKGESLLRQNYLIAMLYLIDFNK